ncbi:MAG: hypothetical protein LBE80_08595, partial [Deltaproteobacteria bacterium]|nr:hypothetical protein [Deltaproteobacteria bacterium]
MTKTLLTLALALSLWLLPTHLMAADVTVTDRSGFNSAATTVGNDQTITLDSASPINLNPTDRMNFVSKKNVTIQGKNPSNIGKTVSDNINEILSAAPADWVKVATLINNLKTT